MDLNGDGHSDILSGSYSRMEQPMAGLFQMLWGKPGGAFKKAEVLKGTDGEPLIIPIKGNQDQVENICTRPFAVDWNGDGHLDLVVGNFKGSFYVFAGEGRGKFRPKPEPLLADGKPLVVEGAHSDPFVVDWDSDGDLDLISGSDRGGVQWAENVAARGKTPDLKPFKTLIKASPPIEHGRLLAEADLTRPAASLRVWADDINGDGKLDLLVGDNVTLIAPAKGVSAKDYETRFAKWQERYQAASKELDGGDEKAHERFSKIYESRKDFMNEDRTGYVWLYLRK